jgi:serine/threonine protein kinase
MGEVYEAVDIEIGDRVAVKLIREDLLRNAEWVERFRREARIAEKLDSPYISRLLAAAVSKGSRRPWVAFELLEGESLDVHLEREPRPPLGDVTWMVRDLLRGLQAAHDSDVIHRDIKPANLFIDVSSNRLRVLDFGVAKLVGSDAHTSGLTRAAQKLGTPEYLSPEQLRSSRTVDARADIYSAGCVAFQLMTGRRPFASIDLVTLLSQKQSGEPSLAAASGVTWPEAMQGWIAQTVAPKPDARFSSARAAEIAWDEAARAMESHHPAPASSADNLREDTDVLPPSSR